MQNVRFLTSVSTADRSYGGGELASLDPVLAGQWVACGFVELIAQPEAPDIEAAPAAEAEATHTRSRRRK